MSVPFPDTALILLVLRTAVTARRARPRADASPVGPRRRDFGNGPRYRKTRLPGRAAHSAAFGQGTALARRIQKPGRSDALP